jgi:uncharacterized protein YkvS
LKAAGNFRGFSPDGLHLEYMAKKGEITDQKDGLTFHVGKLNDLKSALDTGIKAKDNDQFFLTRDRKHVIRQKSKPTAAGKIEFEHAQIDVTTKKEIELKLPEGMQIHGEYPDGQDWYCMWYNCESDKNLPGYRYLKVPKDGSKPTAICDQYLWPFHVPSKDYKSFLAIGLPFPSKREHSGFVLYHHNTDSGKTTELKTLESYEQFNLKWSADHKQHLIKSHKDSDIYVGDISGGNHRKLFTIPNATDYTCVVGWHPTPK